MAVHEFHVWQLAGNRIIASAHIHCQNLNEYRRIAEDVKEFFHNEGRTRKRRSGRRRKRLSWMHAHTNSRPQRHMGRYSLTYAHARFQTLTHARLRAHAHRISVIYSSYRSFVLIAMNRNTLDHDSTGIRWAAGGILRGNEKSRLHSWMQAGRVPSVDVLRQQVATKRWFSNWYTVHPSG